MHRLGTLYVVRIYGWLKRPQTSKNKIVLSCMLQVERALVSGLVMTIGLSLEDNSGLTVMEVFKTRLLSMMRPLRLWSRRLNAFDAVMVFQCRWIRVVVGAVHVGRDLVALLLSFGLKRLDALI